MVTTDTTWAERLNGALDHIGKLRNDKADALDALTRCTRNHPELESDLDIATARLALQQ